MAEYFWTLAFRKIMTTLESHLVSVFSAFDKDPSDKDYLWNTA